MRSKHSGLWCLLIAAGVLTIATCAHQVPSHVSVVENHSITGKTATFKQCNLSVVFTGFPRQLKKYELSKFSEMFTKFFEHKVEALCYEENHLFELAMCICQDRDFSESDIWPFGTKIKNNKDFKFIREYKPSHSKKAFEIELQKKWRGSTVRALFLFPKHSPNCFFMQIVIFDPSGPSSSPAFFNTTSSASASHSVCLDSPPVGEIPKGKTAERLSELDELKRHGLITPDEYREKRKRILNDL